MASKEKAKAPAPNHVTRLMSLNPTLTVRRDLAIVHDALDEHIAAGVVADF
jgi:hypothetical protein